MCTITLKHYRVIESKTRITLEEKINLLADQGYEVVEFSTAATPKYISYAAIMSRSQDREIFYLKRKNK